MRVLTDGYIKLGNEKIKLSGVSRNAPKYAAKLISELLGGDAEVCFKSIDEEAKALVAKEFGNVYKENPEGYIINIAADVTVYADTPRAMIYAANSLLGHYEEGIGKGLIYNYPCCEHRSARVFLPPKNEMPYFKKLIDTLVYHGYNNIVIELGGAMEFKRHPEINDYWIAYCKEYAEYNGKTYDNQISKRIRNSNHTYNAGGAVYSHEEMRRIVDYCAERGLEIIPEVPSLSHSEYLLGPHPELAECADEYFPDTCCPQNDKLYEILFDLYDEVIEVINPKIMHIGHDEWWTMCICDKCRGKDPAKLFADNVNKCYEYLASKGVDAMIWGDKLVAVTDKLGECHGASYKKIYSTDGGKKITLFGKEYTVYDKHWFGYPDDIEECGGIPHEILNTESCAELINANVKYDQWYWSYETDHNTRPIQRGMWSIYGNFWPSSFSGWEKALELGIKGFSVSSWFVTDEIHTQRWATLFAIGYGALLAYARDYDEWNVENNVLDVAHDMYFFRNKDILKNPHIEITHASDVIADKDPHMEKPYIEIDNIKMGEYVVEYNDGSEDKFEVLFSSNVGFITPSFERTESKDAYCYGIKRILKYPIAICDYIKEGDKLWYKIAIPTRSGVKSVKYHPLDEYKNNLHIKEILIK